MVKTFTIAIVYSYCLPYYNAGNQYINYIPLLNELDWLYVAIAATDVTMHAIQSQLSSFTEIASTAIGSYSQLLTTYL